MSDPIATVTIVIRDDPASENRVNVVIESEPSYPLDGIRHDTGEAIWLDVDKLTTAQRVAYAALDELTKIAPGLGPIRKLIVPDTPDDPAGLTGEAGPPA